MSAITSMTALPERWSLDALFPDDAAWEAEDEALHALLPVIDTYRGTLASSGAALLAWLHFSDELTVRAGRAINYAYRRYDEDTRETRAQEMMERASSLETAIATACAWVAPELVAIHDEVLAELYAQSPELRLYAHAIDDTRRMRAHTLNEREETLLALAHDMANVPSTAFGMFNDADISFPSVRDSSGAEEQVTKGSYARLMESPDRALREAAFRSMYGVYDTWKNTLAALLQGQVKREMFFAKSRGYASTLEAALFPGAIPPAVYDTVITSINGALEPLHRSMHLRRDVLGIDAVRPWDLFVPLARESSSRISYSQAASMVREGLAVLGPEYAELLDEAFTQKWIDVEERPGKCSGAYSAWTYGSHPLVLLNYNGTLKDVFTIAHELGHALHSHHTWKAQPPVYASYSIFCAEVASTTNEVLLVHHLLDTLQDAEARRNILAHYIETIRGTVYNQALFAEFERDTHAMAEQGRPLPAQLLGETMAELYEKYYGAAFALDPLYAVNWARIPHFYRSFYVYQYATGLSAAIALARDILAGVPGARDRYFAFLRAGSSKHSIELLKDAGVDMLSSAPFEAAAELMGKLVEELGVRN